MLDYELQNYLETLNASYTSYIESRSEMDPKSIQLFSNLIQGLLLEYIVQHLCYKYAITSKGSTKVLLDEIMLVLQDEFFSRFRLEIKKQPEILTGILNVASETSEDAHPYNRLTHLFLLILPKYFSTDLNLLEWKIETNLKSRSVFKFY